MFRRRILFGVVAFALIAANDAQAQNAAAQAHRERLDSLIPLWRQAIAEMTAADSLRKERELAEQREPLDTIAATPFLVVSPRSMSKEVALVFRRAYHSRREILSGTRTERPIVLLVTH